MSDVLRLFLVVLATFWCWETARFALETYVGRAFAASRAVHPILVAILPVWYYWPDWVAGLAAAGLVGILHLAVERLMGAVNTQPIQIQRPRRRGGLPPLP